MKIFKTGISKIHLGISGKQYQRIEVPRIVYEQLVALGHDVTWANGFEFERPESYDLAFIHVVRPNSFNAQMAISGLYALGRARQVGIPTVVNFDDWKVTEVASQAKSFAKKGRDQLYKQAGGDWLYDAEDVEKLKWVHDVYTLEAIEETILYGAQTLAGELGEWEEARIMYPMFKYGKPERCHPEIWAGKEEIMPSITQIWTFDPSPWVEINPTRATQVAPLFAGEKRRRWILAALVDYSDWAAAKKFEWPVAFYGSRTASMKKKGLQPKRLKTEFDIQAEVDQAWGVLSPPYDYPDSGWFRSRYMYAAHLGSILLCDPRDAELLGGPYAYVAEQYQDIEGYPSNALSHIATDQAAWFKERSATEDEAREMLNQMTMHGARAKV